MTCVTPLSLCRVYTKLDLRLRNPVRNNGHAAFTTSRNVTRLPVVLRMHFAGSYLCYRHPHGDYFRSAQRHHDHGRGPPRDRGWTVDTPSLDAAQAPFALHNLAQIQEPIARQAVATCSTRPSSTMMSLHVDKDIEPVNVKGCSTPLEH